MGEDHKYLRHVELPRVKLFTIIQLGCFVILWTIKQTKSISIIFPLMVLAIIFIRKAFDWLDIFSQRELAWLDDIMPSDEKEGEEENVGGENNNNKKEKSDDKI